MLALTWETEGTALLPDGGEAIRTTSELLELDIVESDTYRVAAKISAHAVEQGVDITDHTEPEQDRVSETVALSARPIDITMVEGTTVQPIDLDNGGKAYAVVPPEGTTRIADAFAELRNLVRNGTLVNVEGAIRPLEQYQIESVSAPRKVETAGLLAVEIVFVEHRTAEVDEVDAPAPRTERGRTGQDSGRETADGDTEGDVSNAPENRSVGAALLDNGISGLRGIFGGGSS